jgi:uncharacterized protein (TIGR03086 family)
MTGSTSGGPEDQLARAVDATERLVVAVRDDEWAEPTGCPEWTVRDLLNHLVGGNLVAAAVLTGEQPPDPSADHLGSDPADAYRRSGQALRAAFARPGALEKVVTVPAGTVPGAVTLHLRLTEHLVHGWDPAWATGQATTGLPAELAEQELAFSRGQLGKIPPDRRPFAPPQPIDDDAPAIDRLAALLGRRPPTSGTSVG